ncbi:MAG: twin-arginine translocase subunit TatC [Bradymonadales bacterium]|nr:twin-arginine translocase subunit TatC [Bradymonadales bacterium]
MEKDEKRMPFLEHLRELRMRIIYCLVAVTVGLIVGWAFHQEIFNWLMAPYDRAMSSLPQPFHRLLLSRLPGSGVGMEPLQIPTLLYRGLIEPFFVYLKAALLAGIFLAIPFIFYQLWAFISPGLYRHEKTLAVPFIAGTSFFFIGGAAFARYVVMEPAVSTLLAVGAQNTEANIMMQDYFGLMSRILLVFGAVFELPVIVMFLALLGFVTHRTMIKYWKWAVVLTFVVGAILTPPDPFTQITLALPLMVLYLLSIGLAYLVTRRRQARLAREGIAPE